MTTQPALFPESEINENIEDRIQRLQHAQSDRMAAGLEEKGHRLMLAELLKEAGLGVGKGYKRGPYTAWLEAEDVKAKCRVKQEEE